MISTPRVAALLLAAVSAAPAVGPDAVWKPPENFRAEVDKKCRKAADFGTCFVAQMRAAGAPDAALEFAKRTGNQGYATSFRDTGTVDIATAEYPYRANENLLVFLVNGQPPMIDVDDLSLLDQKSLDANAVYASLREKYPKITAFPSDRRPGLVGSTKLRNGGQRFVVVYLLKDGCHACANVGDAYVAFQFDVEGKFVGTDVVRVRPRSHF